MRPCSQEDARLALAEWLPLITEALQHAGGDGLDVYLHRLFRAPGREEKQAQSPLFEVLQQLAFEIHAAQSFEQLEGLVDELRATLAEALHPDACWPLCDRKLKLYGNGTLELAPVLALFFSNTRELAARIHRCEVGLEHLKAAAVHGRAALGGATQRLQQLRTLGCAEMRRRGYARPSAAVPLFENPPTNLSRELRAVGRP